MRRGKEAGEWMLSRIKSEAYPRMCKQFVRLGLDVSSKSPDAATCFKNAKFKHKPSNINDTPAFVSAFFDTGKFGHVVYTLNKDAKGRRLCISVDVQDSDNDQRREVGVVPLEKFISWGPFQGWTEDFDGVRVYSPPVQRVAPKPAPPKTPLPSTRKTIKQVAQEVIAGKWGDGVERRARLQKAGYPYAAVQHMVNELLN